MRVLPSNSMQGPAGVDPRANARTVAAQSSSAKLAPEADRALQSVFKSLQSLLSKLSEWMRSSDVGGAATKDTFEPGNTARADQDVTLPDDFVDRPGKDGPVDPPPPPPPDEPFPGKKDAELVKAIHDYTTTGKTSVSYDRARQIIFTDLDVHDGKIRCVYTNREIPGGKVPSSTDMNVEHTWPQSKGATGVAKSDLHHLYPTDSKANSTRGNYPYGIVVDAKWTSPSGAKFGKDAHGHTVFEPPDAHKGNVARSMFYFAATYGKPIDNDEESFLKEWNHLDPVDDLERQRNDKIETYQHNRNPFVDHSELADRIADF